MDAAREALAEGETLLRQAVNVFELGHLFCARGESEQLAGDNEAARAALDAAEEIATRVGLGPEAPLCRAIVGLRQTLAPDR